MSLFKNVLKVLFYILIAIGSVITVLDIFGYNVFSFLQPKMSLTTPELGKLNIERSYKIYTSLYPKKEKLMRKDFNLMIKALKIIVELDIKSLKLTEILATKFESSSVANLTNDELKLILNDFKKTNTILKTELFVKELSNYNIFLYRPIVKFDIREDDCVLIVYKDYITRNDVAYQKLKKLCDKMADTDLTNALLNTKGVSNTNNFNYIQYMFTNWIEFLLGISIQNGIIRI
ncbi:hypothetical protein AAJ76_7400015941 [Vairimorpha ceranae]|uniref:Uncharacterized protein n=1 Tax=Vairimorpha ceranae TaxID=40302 RepID=A0A0F9W9Y3_9MICR|nr:hypothetical protein AAJ76_7400015941 [Vairimorpha ceranae]KAF5140869.1 hypothetical protein G9O61_00g009760 [Vairimorpha ceranae]KAF5141024.1 hypothetical protein G9O61_00g008080 [Vairimorpha ceranae]KKO74421.1 hypothetical protein AAJ76_7400015941 [Vairimorpha ceranae]